MYPINRLSFLIFLFSPNIVHFAKGDGCVIDLYNDKLQKSNSYGKYPLLVNATGDIIYPVGGPRLTFESDDEVSDDKLPQVGLYCHKFSKTGKIQSKVSSASIKPLIWNSAYVPLRCNQDGTFSLFNDGKNFDETVDIHRAYCTSRKNYPVLVKHEEESELCSDIGVDGRTDDLSNHIHYVEIGWNMSAIKFDTERRIAPTKIKDMIQLCIDEKLFGTLWTRHVVRGASLEFQDKGGNRHTFKSDNPYQRRFFDRLSSTRIYNMYKKKEQKKMEKFYGLSNIINTTSGSQDWFAKGHLSPDAAFVYQREQDATYYYVNAAPQFQSFNAQNWRFLEEGVRDLAKSLKRDILTYTGTYGTLSYNDTEMYLWYKKQRGSSITKAIPVPKYYYKVVYDEKENQGVGFVGLNDPYSDDLTEDDYLCKPNVCKEVGWFHETVKHTNVEEKGHISCCSIQDLAKVITNVKSFKTDTGKIIDQDPKIMTCGFKCDDEASNCNVCQNNE